MSERGCHRLEIDGKWAESPRRGLVVGSRRLRADGDPKQIQSEDICGHSCGFVDQKACMERERCWTLVGTYENGTWHALKRRRVNGKPASVEVDWEWTLKREDKRGDVIGFAHTHPSGAGTMPMMMANSSRSRPSRAANKAVSS
jgi:hypothetical protein